MMTEQQYFEAGITLESYMAQMESNQQKSYSIYEKFNLPEDSEFMALLKEKQPHILVITEDWCGDAMMNNAILRKITDAVHLEVHCVYRDENLELMDRYLTNSGRSIPKYIILSKDGKVLGTWGPRAPEVQNFVDEKKSVLPDKDDSQYEHHLKTVIGEISDGFVYNNGFWQIVYEDLRQAFQKALT
ncbi:thioredoxin family protein [Planococcus sp. ANT_H30]|uniref:Thioredoxin n=1 Tax=Planococcus kocurii TaxID=1374 RepID=A0ABN4JZV2_9BACL|nr:MULTISPECIES: thioredoxin family protein [Planococcus]ALS79394.1 thioredoxin [Planococcus kocurii]KAA0955097.1 thioredoxin family protein [Planococcus sp. ANT_H30]